MIKQLQDYKIICDNKGCDNFLIEKGCESEIVILELAKSCGWELLDGKNTCLMCKMDAHKKRITLSMHTLESKDISVST